MNERSAVEGGPATESAGVRAHLGVRPGGRSERVRSAIFEAAAAELVEAGYGHMTLASVAVRAGVAASTVRRRWGTKERLVTATIVEATAERVPTPDLGSLEDDLRAFARSVAEYHADPRAHALVRSTLALPDDELDEIRSTTWVQRAQVSRSILKAALLRGEIPRQRDAGRIIEMLIASIWLRSFVTGEPVGPADLELFVADALAAARAAPSPPIDPVAPPAESAPAPAGPGRGVDGSAPD